MKFFSKLFFSLMIAATVGTLSSCNTSKIAYGNDYYFKAKPKEVNDFQKAVPDPEAGELLATKNVEANITVNEPSFDKSSIAKRIKKAEQDLQEQVSTYQEASMKAEIKEKVKIIGDKQNTRLNRAQRKHLRKEIKSAIKSHKQAPQATEKGTGVSKNTRTGIILGAAGVVLVLIGGGILYTIGAVLLVVGVVLILLDIL